ncbi:MAG TPA: prolipoprotein diacylglyceryl transferase [Bacteroidia bacterium]|nr:prolipoprotein diacylglyceryl transferase [Bacteroidia bacterium]
MYPTIYDAVKDIFGVSIPFLKLLQSFGFFVAIAFLLCAWVFAKELVRKERQGKLKGTFRKVIKGVAATKADLTAQFIFGFLIGWKFIAIFFAGEDFSNDPRAYILSGQGNIYTGLIFGGLFTWWRWRQAEKQRLPEPKEETEKVSPAEHVGNMTLLAALFGFLGAKLFHILENFSDFLNDPGDMLFSFSGLTMYGGLILGAVAVLMYARKQEFSMLHVMDACAPGLLLAYGVGRLGCHISGDGDWGIVNTALMPGWLSFLPEWVWAFDYPNNVNRTCLPDASYANSILAAFCDPENPRLIAPVYPTPLYEAFINIVLFFFFWIFLRKRIVTPGLLFSLYLVFNGLERFFIEIIRVNNVLFTIGSFEMTQAQLIALTLVALGLIGIVWSKKHANKISAT